MLRLFVTPYQAIGKSSSGEDMFAFVTMTENGAGGWCSHHDNREKQLCDDVEIFSNVLLDSFIQIDLSLKLRKTISDFFHYRHVEPDQAFDCYSFVNDFCDIRQHEKSDLATYWKVEKPKQVPRSGDVYFFLDTEKERFHHAAIYLGLGIYVSVYGKGGDIEFASLSDLKSSFGGMDVFHAYPRF